ncbi:hypothetical protein UFOVP536_14 [uncultured Caudovirales phage]|uniref:Uncharacterized protein n=1 Tax=uncultured Caudovirales phage TaxID=2100421 RepID=A0A6J5MS15_9CAUD|nr:hypothetical protein UFOVP536_14 [uncultured Caudovirales phage]
MANKLALPFERAIASAVKRASSAALAKTAEDMRRAVGFAAYHGAMAMRDKVLDSPTGTSWHAHYSAMRGKPGARYETGTMFESIGRSRGKIVESPDRRKRSYVTASFGWPTDSSGMIKDLPTNPLSKGTRMPDNPYGQWHQDPRYHMMQEYGFNLEGTEVPGMFSQQAGKLAAEAKFREFLKSRGYK